MFSKNHYKAFLIVSAVLITPIMLFIFKFTTQAFGTEVGYFIGFICYWVYCVVVTFLLVKNNKRRLTGILWFNLSNRRTVFYFLMALIPVFGVFIIQFIPNLMLLNSSLLILVIVNSVLNGIIEEVYWRGLFLIEFRNNRFIGLWLSSFLFASWHIALYSIQDLSYGGFIPLVAGSALMGAIWAICSRRLNSISFTIIAHILVNLFAFTGFYIKNSFL